jgi:hypothetical protein
MVLTQRNTSTQRKREKGGQARQIEDLNQKLASATLSEESKRKKPNTYAELLAQNQKVVALNQKLLAQNHQLLARDQKHLAQDQKHLAQDQKHLAQVDQLLAQNQKLQNKLSDERRSHAQDDQLLA